MPIRRLSDLGPVSNYRTGARKDLLQDLDLLEVSLKNALTGNYSSAKLDYVTLRDNILKNNPMLPLGSVIYSNRSSVELKGLLPANGTVYTGSTYPEFFQLITSGKLPSVTTTQYNVLLAQYGSVGVYGYDNGATTFRMMTLSESFIKSTNNANNYGKNESAGVPNISGTYDADELTEEMVRSTPRVSGPFGYIRSTFSANADGSTGPGFSITFDASKSSPVYGNSATVTPNNIAMQAYVVVYTDVDTANFNLSGLQDALVYKADTDLNNITTLPISGSSGVATTINSIAGKKYTGPDVVVESWYADDGSAWYRKYKSGWLEQGGLQHITSASRFNDYYKVILPIPYTTNTYNIQAEPDAGATNYIENIGVFLSASNAHPTYIQTTTYFCVAPSYSGDNYIFQWTTAGY